MKKYIFSILTLVCSLAFGHEFWVAPSKFILKIGEKISIELLAGEDFHGTTWASRNKRTAKVTLWNTNFKKDISQSFIKSDSTLPVDFAAGVAGTQVIAFETIASSINLDGEKFNEYLKEDGMPNILALRKEKNELEKPATELYQRCAKAIIQVGNKNTSTFSKNTGMPLEIIPMQNPYGLKIGDKLKIKVLFRNKPVANGLLVSWAKNDIGNTEKTNFITDENGLAFVPISTHKYWMISLVHMVENNTPAADYHSFWGNITFELP